jgi:ribonuclease P protein component
VLERGKRKRTRNLDVFFAASPASHSRVGLVVAKHGHRAVDRNRLKRRLREILRRDVLRRLPEGEGALDLLFRTRRSAYATEFSELREEVTNMVEGVCSRKH